MIPWYSSALALTIHHQWLCQLLVRFPNEGSVEPLSSQYACWNFWLFPPIFLCLSQYFFISPNISLSPPISVMEFFYCFPQYFFVSPNISLSLPIFLWPHPFLAPYISLIYIYICHIYFSYAYIFLIYIPHVYFPHIFLASYVFLLRTFV